MTRAYLDLPERLRFATLKTFPRALRLFPPGKEAVAQWGNYVGERKGGGDEEDQIQVHRTMDRYRFHAFLGSGSTKCIRP